MLIRHTGDCRWEGVSLLKYKEEEGQGNLFRDISRQVLVDGLADLPCQLRYFEVATGGHSTLERHQHAHLVVIFRGEGDILLEDQVFPVREKDVVTIPPQTLHQLRATKDVPLGFLCLVNVERDKPVCPNEEDLKALRRNPAVAAFIRS